MIYIIPLKFRVQSINHVIKLNSITLKVYYIHCNMRCDLVYTFCGSSFELCYMYKKNVTCKFKEPCYKKPLRQSM